MKILNINKRSYPREHSVYSAEIVEISAVLTEGETGDIAVYIGEGSPEWIIKYGNKLSYEEAISYFPFFDESKYRR
jgi:hypothetical protein